MTILKLLRHPKGNVPFSDTCPLHPAPVCQDARSCRSSCAREQDWRWRDEGPTDPVGPDEGEGGGHGGARSAEHRPGSTQGTQIFLDSRRVWRHG